VFVAQRIVSQSVMQFASPTTLPRVGVPPVTLNDIAIVLASFGKVKVIFAMSLNV
jgi:hypothetical protein